MNNNNVALVMTGNEGYGVRTVWHNLIKGLIKQNCKILIFVLDNTFDYKLLENLDLGLIEVIQKTPKEDNEILSDNKFIYLLKKVSVIYEQTKNFFWLSKKARKRNIHSILFQSPTYVFSSLVLRFSGNFRSIWMVPNVIGNNYPFDLNKRLYRCFIHISGITVLPNSVYTSQTISDKTLNGNSKVIYPGVDCTVFDDEKIKEDPRMRQSLGISDSAVVFCIAASLTKIKGHSMLIRALATLNTTGYDLHLIICGGSVNSALENSLKKLTQELGLLNNIHFMGPVDDIRLYYKVCDVVISNTLCPEGFGLSIVEAMSFRRPVIAHALGGPSETVVDNHTGWLYLPATIENLVEAIKRCLSDQPRWRTFGINGRNRALKMFSAETMSKKIYEIIFNS